MFLSGSDTGIETFHHGPDKDGERFGCCDIVVCIVSGTVTEDIAGQALLFDIGIEQGTQISGRIGTAGVFHAQIFAKRSFEFDDVEHIGFTVGGKFTVFDFPLSAFHMPVRGKITFGCGTVKDQFAVVCFFRCFPHIYIIKKHQSFVRGENEPSVFELVGDIDQIFDFFPGGICFCEIPGKFFVPDFFSGFGHTVQADAQPFVVIFFNMEPDHIFFPRLDG